MRTHRLQRGLGLIGFILERAQLLHTLALAAIKRDVMAAPSFIPPCVSVERRHCV